MPADYRAVCGDIVAASKYPNDDTTKPDTISNNNRPIAWKKRRILITKVTFIH
ncbi:hypothetical protein [Chamaesiphon polymorphus]|uniref:hypothetical protein n=1 Tax=Chamaesiphon polymorphus TaxID=2107691 RepID=UPI0015E68BD5|nr:hypothetical protein [Chamaesiphon polymorphus]